MHTMLCPLIEFYTLFRGFPHHRIVWCSDDLSRVYWGDLRSRKVHGYIETGQIESVRHGHETSVFKSGLSRVFSLNLILIVL